MPLELNKKYDFKTYAPAILGGSYHGMLVESTMDYTNATHYRDVTNTHKEILPYLPTTTPKDPKLLTYVLFSDTDGNRLLLAQEWIDASSIKEVAGITAMMTLENVSMQDIEHLKKVVISLGLGDKIKVASEEELTTANSYKGVFDTKAELINKHPTGKKNDFAIVKVPFQIWIWDINSNDWITG